MVITDKVSTEFVVFQAKSLFKKISGEADNLRNLWVAKLNLQGKLEMASEEDLQAYEIMKVEVMMFSV